MFFSLFIGVAVRESKDSMKHVYDFISGPLLYGSTFMLISRCGLDANEFFDREDFADIVNFNTPATINAIGVATSDIAEMALREISPNENQ